MKSIRPPFDPDRSSITLNAQQLLISAQIMDTEELGQMFICAINNWQHGDPSLFQVMPWVDGFTFRKPQTKPDRYISPSVRADVLAIGYCLKCGTTELLSVDHIRPISKGGGNERENLQCLCMPCNIAKSATWEGDC